MVITGDFYWIIYVYIISCHIRGCESNQGSAALLSLASKAPDRTVRDPGSRLPHCFAGNISQVRRDPTRLQVDYIIIIILSLLLLSLSLSLTLLLLLYIHIMISHHISSYLIISHDCLQSFMLISAVLPAQRFSPGLIELDHGFSASILRDRGGRDWWF